MAKDSKGESPFIHRLPVKDRSGKIVGYKEVVAYRGLLHLAHEAGLRSVRTEILQFPTVDNGQSAIVQASVRTWRGTFTGIGEPCTVETCRRVVVRVGLGGRRPSGERRARPVRRAPIPRARTRHGRTPSNPRSP
ncbi:MAG: hypothetical protein KF729_36430 [Sandaracinaceae bacterium]|nr:hypothetical protein [Sandaracinaceae bacterium]